MGESSLTESVPSYVVVEAPLPTETYRLPEASMTGPPVAQTAPSRDVGTTYEIVAPEPLAGTPTTSPLYWPQSPASPPKPM